MKRCERCVGSNATIERRAGNTQGKCAGYKGCHTTCRLFIYLTARVSHVDLAELHQHTFDLAPLRTSAAMNPNVLYDIAVEELGCVPDGQAYSIDQFLVRICLDRGCSLCIAAHPFVPGSLDLAAHVHPSDTLTIVLHIVCLIRSLVRCWSGGPWCREQNGPRCEALAQPWRSVPADNRPKLTMRSTIAGS